MAIGICDWGIGGLGFYGLLRDERPDLDVIYIGDQGVPGYGLFDRASLASRLQKVFHEFERYGVTDVVVACNAASTVVDDFKVQGIRGHGIIEPTVNAIGKLPKGTIGLIGGRRTIRSGVYRRVLQAQGWKVQQRVAQPLSRRIEDGEAHSPETITLLSKIIKPLKGVDYLVLACTHYIVLAPEICRSLPDTKTIDPATEAWRQFRLQLPEQTDRIGTSQFLTTGSAEAMQTQARMAFGVEAYVEEIEV